MKTIDVQSMVDLLNVDHNTLDAGDRIRTMSYHPPVFPSTHFFGGRSYIWTPTRPKVDHDGGTYISLTCPWDGSQAGLADFLNGVGDLDPCSNGCLVLENPLEVYVEDYGAVGDGFVDDGTAMNAALNRKYQYVSETYNRAGIVRLRDTDYLSGSTLELKSAVEFRGAYSQEDGTMPCRIMFEENVTGIISHRFNTLGSGTVDPASGSSGNSLISGIAFWGKGNSDVGAHGLWMRKSIKVENCQFERFPGNGVNIVAHAGSGDPAREGNANCWSMTDILCRNNQGHGVYVDGPDVNAGYGARINCTHNVGWGIYDSSFLGNTWVGCHTAVNDLGGYRTDNANARTVFIGCYSEADQPKSSIVTPSISLGGIHGQGAATALGAEAYGGDGNQFSARRLWAKDWVTAAHGDTDYAEYFIAHNTQASLNERYETGFMSQCSYKADGTTPRPAGGMFCRPQGTNRDSDTVVGFYVYTGETTDTMVKVARFWGTERLEPTTDNVTDLGSSGNQWKDIYLANSPTVSSDATLKQDVEELTDAEHEVAKRLKALVRTYRFKDAVKKKGNGARTHVGIIAQDVVAAFHLEGLDVWEYGIVCRGPGPNGVGERFSVRYEELLAFMIAAL